MRRPTFTSCSLSLYRSLSANFPCVISEIEIWRAANLLLKHHGDKARAEGTARADALAAAGDLERVRLSGAGSRAVAQLANKTPRGAVH